MALHKDLLNMDSDDRFKHLASDPKFRILRRKQRKIVIDDRFKSMFSDEKFTLKCAQDKRGSRKLESIEDNLRKYYSIKDDSESATDDVTEEENHIFQKKTDDCQNLGDEEDELDTSETESNISTSSDEPESEIEDIDGSEITYDWQPLDHEAETAEKTSRRLAIQNLDWDRVNAQDLYVLMNSIRPPQAVTIYVSEFGKERLAEEELAGPMELVASVKDEDDEEDLRMLEKRISILKDRETQKSTLNEYEDADDCLDLKDDEVRSKIRRYQLNKMKYYYAVVDFDSEESSEIVYNELDGREFEGTSIELDLRFVPDDVQFDQANIYAKCDKLPDMALYKAPQFINSALQQTSVKFTWDETDAKRQEKLRRSYTKKELERDDLDAYLASESDSDVEESCVDEEENDARSIRTENSDERTNKYKKLLASLDEAAERKKKLDVDVEWGNYEDEEAETSARKRVKTNRSQENQTDNELDLLVMEAKERESCKFDPDDKRFDAIYTSGEYNIDPSHPSFKRTAAFDIMAEKKRQRRNSNVAKSAAPKPNRVP